MSETKLLPCPFCGGEAKYISFTQGLFVQRFVTCTKCGIETKRNYANGAKAVRHWNTRKPIDDIVERLKENLLVVEIEDEHIIPESDVEEYFELKVVPMDMAIDIVRNAGKDGAE